MCLAMCLKFPEFETGCAYKLIAYKKKRVSWSERWRLEKISMSESADFCAATPRSTWRNISGSKPRTAYYAIKSEKSHLENPSRGFKLQRRFNLKSRLKSGFFSWYFMIIHIISSLTVREVFNGETRFAFPRWCQCSLSHTITHPRDSSSRLLKIETWA